MLQPRTRPLHFPLPPGRRDAPPAKWPRLLRLTPRAGWPLTLWRLAWAPWWLGSEMPPPPLPDRTLEPAPTAEPAHYVAQRLDGLARRFHTAWLLLLAVRGLWLGLVLSALWVVVAVLTGAGAPGLGAVLALTLIGGALGVGLGLFVRPDRRRLARMLDRSFGLDERLTTAVELLAARTGAAGRRQGLDDVQLADAGNQLALLHLPGRLSTLLPVRELMLLLLAMMLLLALAFAGLDAPGIPAPSRAAIPAYIPASQRLAAPDAAVPQGAPMPSVAEIQERSRRANEARRDLDVLGEALGEHPSTLPAAEAIAAADYPGAATALRQTAADASQLLPAARSALADDLDHAASGMSEGSPELASAAQDAADGLRAGGAEAETGVGGLADEVAATGEEVVPQQELAEQQAAAAQGSSAQPAGGSETAGEAGAGAAQQPGGDPAEGQSGGEPGAAGDPGAGVDARAGDTSGDPASGEQGNGQQQAGAEQSGDGGGENQPGDAAGAGEEGAMAGQGQPGEQGQDGFGAGQPGEAQSSNDRSGDAPSSDVAGGDRSGDSSESGQGSGAGSGAANPDDPSGEGQSRPGGEQGPPSDRPDEPMGNVVVEQPPANPGGAGAQPTAVPGTGDASVSLPGQSDESIQTGGSAGSASLGSGTGAGAGGGDVEQGTVGEAGPDSNRVPADYRDVVSSYFDEEELP